MIEIKHRYTNATLHTVDSDALGGANLGDANLGDANLRDANLRGANLRDANLRGAKGIASRTDAITRLDEIRTHVIEHGDPLNMSAWHGSGWTPDTEPVHACQTAHCLAGWAQALSPDLEMRNRDPVHAGVLLLGEFASRFWDDDEVIRHWLANREYAEVQE